MNKRSKILLALTVCFTFAQVVSQERVELKEVYYENNLVYKIVNDSLFTGIVHRTRKNGHIVYEEKYEKGIILNNKLYYNRSNKMISEEIIYNSINPNVRSKKIKYGLSKDWKEITYYNEVGEKELIEKFTKEKLFYSCEFLNNKKHGIEFTLCNDKKLFINYVNGKKQK